MNAKAAEMMKIFQLAGKDYSIWDCLSFACITLISAASDTPQLKVPTMQIVGLLIDSNIADEASQQS